MVQIEIGGIVHTLLNKWTISPYLAEDYINNACIILTDPPVYIPDGSQCALCGRAKENTPGNTLTISRFSRLNQNAGYVLKICIYCKFWCHVQFEHYDMDMIPSKIARHMVKPKNVDKYL